MTGSDGFFSVAGRQRACRSFSSAAVDERTLERVLHAATRAPSAENSQPWVFVVVRSGERRAEIGALTRAVWEAGARTHSQDHLEPGLLAEVDRGATGGIAAAPVVVVVGVDTQRCPRERAGSSIFPAVQNLLLAATAVGLGSALTTLATLRPDELRRIVDLPEAIEPVAVVPLGWPAAPASPPRRAPLATRVHDEVYGRRADWLEWQGSPPPPADRA